MTFRRVFLLLGLAVSLALVVGAIAGAMLLSHGGLFSGQNQSSTSQGGDAQADVPPDATLTCTGLIDVDRGILPLSPLQTGLILKILVREGQRVDANTPLVELDNTLAESQVKKAKAEVREAELQVELAQEAARKFASLVEQQKLAVQAAEKRLSAQKTQIQQLEELVKTKVKDKLDLKFAQEQLSALELELDQAKSKAKELENTNPLLPVQLATRKKDEADASLTAAQKQLSFCTLTAPAPGVVLRIQASQGQVWNGMLPQPAIWFRPDEPWIVRCEVEQRYVYRVHEGMECEIFDDRLDKPSWKGKVQHCSRWIGPKRQQSDTPLAWHDVKVMECIIVLDKPQEEPLIGQRVRVVFRGKQSP